MFTLGIRAGANGWSLESCGFRSWCTIVTHLPVSPHLHLLRAPFTTLRMIRVGIIGLGAMGRLHFQSWKTCPGAQIGAISARDPKLRAGDWGGKEFNLGDQSAERVDLSGITPYERAEDLIADPAIDAVDICTSTPQHAPLAIAALRAGKHVLCEKPMALTLAECDAMQAAADESGKILMIAHCLRFWPHYLKAASIIKSGEFGRPLYARASRERALHQSGVPAAG